LKFIIPLPRNSSLIDYEKVKSGDRRLFEGYFQYGGRYIWHYPIAVDNKKTVTVFLDEELRNREEKDYLNRIESKAANYSLEKFLTNGMLSEQLPLSIIQASLPMKPGPTTKRADRWKQ